MFSFKQLGDYASFFFGTGTAPSQRHVSQDKKLQKSKRSPPEVREVIAQTKKDAPKQKAETNLAESARIETENKKDGVQPWETELEKEPAFAAEQTTAEHRAQTISSVPKVKPVYLPFQQPAIDKNKRQMLFINPGQEAIQRAVLALKNNWELPKWAEKFKDNLLLKGDRILFDGKLMATPDEKRVAVKRLYFDPKGPSTILPITDSLRENWANVTKRDVTLVLRSLETYQRNFGRRQPPKVLGKMNLANPGVIAMDMFFPSKMLGWRKINVLACIDCWSRFCWCYALERKDKKSTHAAMQNFLQRFASNGHMPRRILCDKGTDLAPAKDVIERYRLPKDGQRPMVFHSATGTPVNIIEAFNAQVQRRLQVFRTSKITDDVSTILDDICEQLNNQKRPTRGNMTPLQLLTLDSAQRLQVNRNSKSRDYVVEVPGLRPIFVGNKVRLLLMTRKEQAVPKTHQKGFAPKWSKEIYTVIKMRPIPKNKDVFRYYIGRGQPYFRHELLLLPKETDRTVYKDKVSHKEKIVAPEEQEWEAEYEADAYDSDDSRA